MTDTCARTTQRLEIAFRHIAQARMAGMAVTHASLIVQAMGFRSWNGDCLGVLITPWAMNLVCLPGGECPWAVSPIGTLIEMELPSGNYEFLTAREETLGPYLSSSLFSPMFGFKDMEQARQVALAVLEEVFTPQARMAASASIPASALDRMLDRPISRRAFLGACLGRGRQP
ncbi:MAG TPA: [NiFe]-hydrogenase assembly chaperone HybE [Thiobacillaceae bacterium]|nr:[NiFe]-hydrogenase assembly chaperone HybE [Thiobacillaceae bacterium]HNU63320.1 [NiFe]-hydrogenase assembly chaperone HybE [Thiobacillaceae bacterium]